MYICNYPSSFDVSFREREIKITESWENEPRTFQLLVGRSYYWATRPMAEEQSRSKSAYNSQARGLSWLQLSLSLSLSPLNTLPCMWMEIPCGWAGVAGLGFSFITQFITVVQLEMIRLKLALHSLCIYEPVLSAFLIISLIKENFWRKALTDTMVSIKTQPEGCV